MYISVRPRRSAQDWKDYNLLKLVLTKIFMHFSTTSGLIFGRMRLLDRAGPIDTAFGTGSGKHKQSNRFRSNSSGSFAMFAAIRRAPSRRLEIKHGDKRL